MKLGGLSATLCVAALVVLLSADVSEARISSWLKVLNFLPRSLRWKVKIGLGAAWAYTTSKRGFEIEDVVDTVFDLIPGETKKIIKTSPGETLLPNKLGYVCWSTGTAEGAENLKKKDNVVATESAGVTTVEAKFGFEKLVLKLDACGNRSRMFKKVSRCTITLVNTVFKVTMKVKDIGSIARMAMGALKRQCVLTFVDIKLEELGQFKLVPETISKRTGHVRHSFRDSLAKTFAGLSPAGIKLLTNEIVRVNLYRKLKTTSAAICKDITLEEMVKERYPNYLAYVEGRSEGEGELGERYAKTCGKAITTGQDIEEDDADDEKLWPKDE